MSHVAVEAVLTDFTHGAVESIRPAVREYLNGIRPLVPPGTNMGGVIMLLMAALAREAQDLSAGDCDTGLGVTIKSGEVVSNAGDLQATLDHVAYIRRELGSLLDSLVFLRGYKFGADARIGELEQQLKGETP